MNIKYNKALWLIIILAIVMMIPFLGLTDFNTKGEPREAVVAYTMLEHGNWILPINNGGDIPYKPPFFHWCIAFFSLFIGHVNEYTSRLPSAVSLVLMTVGGFVFYAKRKNAQTSLIAAILTLTAFEVHRAGMNCRVDMVNTAFMVGAMYLLYRWWEKGKHQLPWLAILCMSGATLTKGPVGIILPCFVMGVFMLTQRENFWGIVWRMALTALLSLVIPFCWYYAAYLQGGDEFLRLVKEENSHPHAHRLRGTPCGYELPCRYGEHRLYGGSHVSALPLVGERKAPVALARYPLHEWRYAYQRSCGHHSALLRNGRIHAYPT